MEKTNIIFIVSYLLLVTGYYLWLLLVITIVKRLSLTNDLHGCYVIVNVHECQS